MATMDGEFINLFVQKQKDTLSETMSRCLMVETRLSINESKLQQLTDTHKEICEEYERTRAALMAEIEARKTVELKMVELKERLKELTDVEAENKRQQKLINGLNVQVEILKSKLETTNEPTNLK